MLCMQTGCGENKKHFAQAEVIVADSKETEDEIKMYGENLLPEPDLLEIQGFSKREIHASKH